MKDRRLFLMAGGGTGGHVIPLIAVARELRNRGHEALFVGTRRGLEAKLVPAAGFPIEWVEIGGLKRVGMLQTLKTIWQLPAGILRMLALIRRRRPAAVFSMGGYAAGPLVLAAMVSHLPLIVMEPNAMPGVTNRKIGRFVTRALVSFPEAQRFFPPGRSEVTGLPVRPEFFAIKPRPVREPRHREATGDGPVPETHTGAIANPEQLAPTLNVLITGGSRGSRTLNTAASAAWPLFRESALPARFVHQTGDAAWAECDRAFRASGLDGEVVRFIDDMPRAYAAADLVVCRSGAGAVAELAAAGKPAILVPFPFAADEHQLRNAEVLERAGAARLVLDKEMDGPRLHAEVTTLAANLERLETMGASARQFARPGAAATAADRLEEFARNV